MMPNLTSQLLLFFLGVHQFSPGHCLAHNDYFLAMKSLVNKLTNNSKIVKEILPVVDAISPVNLQMEIVLRQIATVDEVNQAVRLNMWFRLFWNNPFLQWDPNDFQGIDTIHLDSELFWTPDLALFNKASLSEETAILYKRLGTNLIIHHSGNCTWLFPVTVLAQCRIVVSRFPFDKQYCPITFGSWTHNKYEIDFTNRDDKAELNYLIPNGEWEVLSADLKKTVRYYSVKKIPYPEVALLLRIKRRPLYYRLNLITPCAVIALLSFMSFILPSDHGERITLVITVLLANSVYMLIVSSFLPQTSDSVPIIVKYFLCIMIEVALSLFATCITLKICAYKTEMPGWVETMVNKRLARLMFLGPETEREDEKEKPTGFQIERLGDQEKTKELDPSAWRDTELLEIGFQSSVETPDNDISERILKQLCCIGDGIRLKQSEEFLAGKWRRTAKVLDRLFLFLFLFVYLVLTLYLVGSV